MGAQLTAKPGDPVDGPANIDWDLGYAAAAATALQEYYNPYKTGGTSHTPGNAGLDGLIDAINATADPDDQSMIFLRELRHGQLVKKIYLGNVRHMSYG